MPSRRVPHTLEPNPWSRLLAERRAAGDRLLDLTESNPTRVGLAGALAGWPSASDPALACYDPDPRGTPDARAAITAYYAGRGAHVRPEHVVLTAGTSEGYAHLFRLLADPGETVLVPAPSYPLFEPLAALEGVRVRTYRLAWDGAWHLDRASLERAIGADARAVVVVQPNHPTGSCLAVDERAWLEHTCARHGMAIIADEVFADHTWDDAPPPSFADAGAVLTFVLSGLSKVCGLPQLKLGWIVAAGPAEDRDAALRALEWIADLFLSVSGPVQAALPRLLDGRHAFQAGVGARIRANLATLEALTRRHPEVTRPAARGGWTAMLRVPAVRDDDAWAMALLRRGVVAHPGHFYDVAEGAWLVVSLLPPPDVFAEAVTCLEALLAEG